MLKAIETKYKGIPFRSRIEARWALFYDKIKQPFEYEKEGYIVGNTPYLPDFWMPKQDCFIEIKGERPTLEEEAKASMLAKDSGKRVFIFFGGIPTIDQYGLIDFNGEDCAWVYFTAGDDIPAWDSGYLWCRCPKCGTYGVEFEGEANRIGCCDYDGDPNPIDDTLIHAYHAARSARF